MLTRRELLQGLSAGAACALAPRLLFAQDTSPRLGAGTHQYEWVSDWPKLPDIGPCHGGTAIDSKGRIYFNSDSERAVMIFEPDGTFVKAWGKDLGAGLHGMELRKEGDQEFLYMVHLHRHAVLKATIDGEIVLTLGYPRESKVYTKADQYTPTGVSVAPNGDLYVTDGYGLYWVHQYTAKGEYVRSWGGKGSEDGKLFEPHGIIVDTRGETPTVIVGDRRNHRLQIFSLEGKHLRTITGHFRMPGAFDIRGDDLLVGDLQGRLTILDKEFNLVTHLGDNEDPRKRGDYHVPKDRWVEGQFVAPHTARWDAGGNLYVNEWLAAGRFVKLKRLS